MLDDNLDKTPTEEIQTSNPSTENLEETSTKSEVQEEPVSKEAKEVSIEIEDVHEEPAVIEAKEVSTEIEEVQEEPAVIEAKEVSTEIEEVKEEPATKKAKEVSTKIEEVKKEPVAKKAKEVSTAIEEVQEESVAKKVKEVSSEIEEVKIEPADKKIETTEKTEEVENTEEIVAVEKKSTSVKESEKLDISKLDLEGLISALQKLLKNDAIHLIKNDVEEIKSRFNQQFGALLAEKKKSFLDDGGNIIDFQYHSPFKSQYNDLLFEYKVKREKHYQNQKQEQADNLTKRVALIDELKALIDNAEPSTMYKQFKELQDKWRTIGKIPHANYNDIWRTFHHHVERFYDLLHLNNDFRDLDFKHNLEEKLKLVQRAEALTEESDVNKAFKELQILHKLWKEDIGPVAQEFREEVWGKFSAATKSIHNSRHDFQKNLESKYEGNVELKQEVINEIKGLTAEQKITSHGAWQQKIKELEVLRQKFFKIGKVPRVKNEEIWDGFKTATADFNRDKNAFYKDVKKEQQVNLDKKRALVEKAISLKEDTDWDVATPIMKKIQAEWKSIGHVPRKFSDTIWKEFKEACNYYFDKLHGVQDEANKDQIEIFNKKKEMLEGLKSQAEDNESLSLELIQSYVDDWKTLGNVPHNMRHIEAKFSKFVDKSYEKLNLSKNEIAMLRFKNLINTYVSQQNYRKIDDEQLFVRKKIDEVNREIKQLENNIGFFSSATDDNPLLKNVRDNIEKYGADLEVWKEKLNYLKKLDY